MYEGTNNHSFTPKIVQTCFIISSCLSERFCHSRFPEKYVLEACNICKNFVRAHLGFAANYCLLTPACHYKSLISEQKSAKWMEISVLLQQCTLRNIELVAAFVNILSQFIQVVGILGLCKLSVFLIGMEKYSSQQFLTLFLLVQIVFLSWVANFLPSLGLWIVFMEF